MSGSSSPVRPPYTLKLANTKNEVEACYDIRMEGTSALCVFFFETSISAETFFLKKKTADKALQCDTVFCVEQGFSVEDEMDEYVVPSGDSN